MLNHLLSDFKVLRIPQSESEVYAKKLVDLGYDDEMLSFQHIFSDDLEFMKIGHRARFKKYLSKHHQIECLQKNGKDDGFTQDDGVVHEVLPTSDIMPVDLTVVKDPFMLLKIIGSGCSGRVFLCVYAPTLTFVAVSRRAFFSQFRYCWMR